MSIFLKTEDKIELMREADLLVGKTLAEIGRHVKSGVITLQLDKTAEELIRDNGAMPTFRGHPSSYGPPFSGSVYASINDAVVYRVPGEDVILRDGDIISVDCGTLFNDFNGDSYYTFCVGEVSEDVKKLLRVTKGSLHKGIGVAQAGHRMDDIGQVTQDHCRAQGYGIVRRLTGHGIGCEVHEEPPVPNYGKRGSGALLKTRTHIVIEPMVAMGGREIGLSPDHWSIVACDCYPAVHFEHTIAIRIGEVGILSSFKEVERLERQGF